MSADACYLGEYYAERAAEYDEVYRKPERQEDLAKLRQLLPPLVAGKRVLEVASGTGYWTQVLRRTRPPRSRLLTSMPRQSPLRPSAATARRASACTLPTPTTWRPCQGDFDLVFCGFWWSHIRRADIPRFLAGVRERTGPGTGLILLDNRYVPGSSQPVTRTGPDGDTYQQRELADGRGYEVLKNFPDGAQLEADLAGVAVGLTWTELEYFWLAACVLA